MTSKQIDWINHLIAFGASVIGIFIAFQLDDWQEQRSRQKDLDEALVGIRAELENNISIYQKTDSVLHQFLDYADFFIAHQEGSGLLVTERELLLARKRNPDRLSSLKLVARVNDSVSRYSTSFVIDVLPYTGITTGNWDAAKSSGVLAYLDHKRIALLSQVYDWTTKKLGVSDEEFYNNSVITLSEFTNAKRMIDDYRLIMKAARVKHQNMKMYYDQIKW